MNVVMFGKGFGKPRQVNLSGRSAAFYGLGIVGLLGSAAFAGGDFYVAKPCDVHWLVRVLDTLPKCRHRTSDW